ncbi:MAG: hypothetical protein QM733_23790 [Ilumatobacteraceae bacterium]
MLRSRLRVLLVVVATLLAACGSSSTSMATADLGGGLRGPSGVAATTVATGLTNVAALAFDGDGRLWAATSSMSDDGTDAVYLVGDGGAPTKVIAGVHTPLGLLWLGDELFVAQGKEVDAYGGFDGTTFTSQRTVVTFGDGVGELNELVQLPDGRLALGISAPCNACTVTDEHAAAVVTFQPDGSDLQVMAGGIRAPVGLTVFDGQLLVTMNQRDDLGDDTPGDWLAVVTDGQSWGFPDVTASPAPLAVLDAHAAVSGVAVLADGIGSLDGPVAVVAEWNTGKVLAVALDGDSTPRLLLSGMEHPMPVVAGADGSLYVGDWASGTVVRLTPAS